MPDRAARRATAARRAAGEEKIAGASNRLNFSCRPTCCKGKVGAGGSGSVDLAAAITRGETAMEQDSRASSPAWPADAMSGRLSAAHPNAYVAKPARRDSRAALLRAALDIKGLAATFDFPR